MTRQSELRSKSARERPTTGQGIAVHLPAAERRSVAAGSRPQDRVRPHGVAPAGTRPIPNISIRAFCEASGTADALQTAGADRRMAKAHLQVTAGGIDAAVADRAGDGPPDLIVVETSLPRPLLLSRLDALADRCDPATRLIVIGTINDVGLYRELIRRGVGEYLIAPVTPVQLIDVVAGLCGSAGGVQAGKVIAFIGAKGGVGSSTVCHNVAWAISEIDRSDVIVADLDVAFGTAGLDFNQETMQGIAEALRAPERLDEGTLERLLTRCSQRLSILAAPVALDREYDISAGACGAVIEALRQHAPYTALDLPHLWTPWIKQVLAVADEIVLTAAPDLANLRNAKNLVDFIDSLRSGGKPPHVVLNMAKRPRHPDISVEDFSVALDLAPEMVIEFDGETFGLAATNGQMIEELSRKARAAQQFRALAQALARTLAQALAQPVEPLVPVKASPLAPILDKLRLRA